MGDPRHLYCSSGRSLDVEGHVDLEREVAWLGDILGARGFPLEHLARNLELGADVVDERLGEGGARAGHPAARRGG